MMLPSPENIRTALPYVLLAGAVGLTAWSFLRSEQYRAESNRIFSETYEVQWRTTQIREYLTSLDGDLRLIAVTQQLEPDLGQNVTLLSANVTQLLRLYYVEKFLGERDTKLLEEVEKDLRTRVCPLVEGGTDVGSAMTAVADSKQKMFQISGTAVAHTSTLAAAAHIASAASRNRLVFGAALAIVTLCYALLHMRYLYARRRDQHQQSFSALYTHMTRSPVTALRLFLGYLDSAQVQDPEMLTDARKAVVQLEMVADGMNALAYTGVDTRKATLSIILDQISSEACELVVDATAEARVSIVPAAAMQVMLSELLKNAEVALVDRNDAQIHVTAAVRRHRLFNTRTLNIEVQDNGPGMSAEVARRSLESLFTTRAGSHVGLGLPACAQMAAALKGNLTIASNPGAGTSVRITIPAHA